MFITSCGRPDLLRRTLESMRGSKRITRLTIHEDSPNITAPPFEWPGAEWVFTGGIGQHASIYKFLSEFQGKYYYHCEDDWQFESGAALDASIDASMILMNEPQPPIKVMQRIGSPHPIGEASEYINGFGVHWLMHWMNDGIEWTGFSWNPGVTDAKRVKYHMDWMQRNGEPWSEHGMNGYIGELWNVALSPGIYTHIGDHNPTDRSNEL